MKDIFYFLNYIYLFCAVLILEIKNVRLIFQSTDKVNNLKLIFFFFDSFDKKSFSVTVSRSLVWFFSMENIGELSEWTFIK